MYFKLVDFFYSVVFRNPTPEQSGLLQNVVWPTVNANNYQYLDIDYDLQVKTTPKVSYPLWKQAYENYGSKPYVTYWATGLTVVITLLNMF